MSAKRNYYLQECMVMGKINNYKCSIFILLLYCVFISITIGRVRCTTVPADELSQ